MSGHLTHEDLRAAVARGILTEGQSAQLIALAAARHGARGRIAPVEEPFVLFRGFNEIFVVVGLTILFTGWVGVLTIFGLDMEAPAGAKAMMLSVLTLAALAGVGRYFTLKRRMIAPSIALSVMSALTACVLGLALAGNSGGNILTVAALVVAAVMAGHYAVFRVPFSAALIAGALFVALWSVTFGATTGPALFFLRTGQDMTTSLVTVLFGLVTFAIAMMLDMSDPMRLSTRSATAFWLHVVASPAIVNPVALTLLDKGTPAAQALLLAFLLGIALIAIVIDRRSFLVSGAGYSVILASTLFQGAAALAILMLGAILVLLGSLWERLRARLMQALPDFPGKSNLPPYGPAA